MSLISELFSTIDKGYLGGISEKLGESDQSVTRGVQTSMAAVLGGLASHSENPGTLRRILDLAPAGDLSWANAGKSIADPNSSLLTTGKHILSGLFGTQEGAVTAAIAAHAGLKSGVTSSLMAMAAPMVMSFLGRRVRDEGMTMGGLGNLLNREAPSIRAALPAGLGDMFWPRETATTTRPVVAQTVTREASTSSANWLLPLFLLALIPGLIWLFHHSRPATPGTITIPRVGTANRSMPLEVPAPALPALPKASNIDLYFATGSSKLRPESETRLRAFVATLKPGDHVTVGGYTDNVGNEEQNLKLSQRRADTVMAEIKHKGIAADRLTAQGYGEENPIANNDTLAGRARNRRVSVGMME